MIKMTEEWSTWNMGSAWWRCMRILSARSNRRKRERRE